MTPRNGLKSWLNIGRQEDTGRREAGSILVLWHTAECWLLSGMEGDGLHVAKMCSVWSRTFTLKSAEGSGISNPPVSQG